MITQELYNNYQARLLQGDRQECAKIVSDLISQDIILKNLYVNLFQRSMYEVGTLWESNRISVAVEHMATAITENLLNLAYPLIFSSERVGKKAVIGCTPGEHHQIGAKMVADHFELYGWDSYFLGADIPSRDLIQYVTLHKPDLICLSMSVCSNLQSLKNLVSEIRNSFPDLLVLVGGQGFRWGGHSIFSSFNNVHVISSLDELEDRFLKPD